jgi:hypothetical protein
LYGRRSLEAVLVMWWSWRTEGRKICNTKRNKGAQSTPTHEDGTGRNGTKAGRKGQTGV